MRLALILSLTMLLLGCDQIQLRVGSSETETEIDSLKWEFTANHADGDNKAQGWLLNKETGELRRCVEIGVVDSLCEPTTMVNVQDGRNTIYPKSPLTPEEVARRQELLEESLGDGQPTNESGVPDFSL